MFAEQFQIYTYLKNEKNIYSLGFQMLLISSSQERSDLLFEFSSFEDSSKAQQDYSEEAFFQFFVYKMGFYTTAFWLFSVTRCVIASNPNKLSWIKPTNTECCSIRGPQSALWGQRRRTVCNPLLLGTYCWTWETKQRPGAYLGPWGTSYDPRIAWFTHIQVSHALLC